MIVTCTGCQTSYRLDAAKVPHRRIRVRCPDCRHIFDLDGAARNEVTSPAATLDSVPGLEGHVPQWTADHGGVDHDPFGAEPPGLSAEPTAAPQETIALDDPGEPAPPPPAAAHIADDVVATPPVAEAAEAPRPGRRRRRDKSEMLARALVSDILVYNRQARDDALAAGNLLEVLGPEIKKSWELYKEKVGAETATGTTYFKDALNEILAEGHPVF
jgi:predicted Zn finger-like uncharacterized protein